MARFNKTQVDYFCSRLREKLRVKIEAIREKHNPRVLTLEEKWVLIVSGKAKPKSFKSHPSTYLDWYQVHDFGEGDGEDTSKTKELITKATKEAEKIKDKVWLADQDEAIALLESFMEGSNV